MDRLLLRMPYPNGPFVAELQAAAQVPLAALSQDV
jgi:hypothetical protein